MTNGGPGAQHKYREKTDDVIETSKQPQPRINIINKCTHPSLASHEVSLLQPLLLQHEIMQLITMICVFAVEQGQNRGTPAVGDRAGTR